MFICQSTITLKHIYTEDEFQEGILEYNLLVPEHYLRIIIVILIALFFTMITLPGFPGFRPSYANAFSGAVLCSDASAGSTPFSLTTAPGVVEVRCLPVKPPPKNAGM